ERPPWLTACKHIPFCRPGTHRTSDDGFQGRDGWRVLTETQVPRPMIASFHPTAKEMKAQTSSPLCLHQWSAIGLALRLTLADDPSCLRRHHGEIELEYSALSLFRSWQQQEHPGYGSTAFYAWFSVPSACV